MRSFILVVIVALLGGGAAVAYVGEEGADSGAQALAGPRDAGTDALLPPEARLPDAGLLADAGSKMAQ